MLFRSSSDFEYIVVKKYIESLGTVNYGVERRIRDMSVQLSKESSDDPSTPEKFQMLQNYPNPFNPSTTISYVLPEGTHITLSVYNSLGQVIAVLLNGYQDAGEYGFEWNGEGQPSGVYFYTLQTDVTSMTGKMLLLK